MSIKIIPFEPQLSTSFRDLNKAWLEKYFYVEQKDLMLLENCEESIINKDGHIFFAKYHEAIVGCFSFIKLDSSTYELGKMAVDQEFQGMYIGQQLLSFALDFAKKNNWNKVILYSSTKLDTALHIYKKYGFKEVALEKDLPYERSDIKMEIQLKKYN